LTLNKYQYMILPVQEWLERQIRRRESISGSAWPSKWAAPGWGQESGWGGQCWFEKNRRRTRRLKTEK
jgi:hypothetical protein